MHKASINFSFFPSFIIRTPSFPINFYNTLTNDLNNQGTLITEILNDNYVKEAIFLASPELYDEVQKWVLTNNYPNDKINKLKITLLKYFTRMSTRCTPFGLFSACGSGKFGKDSIINFNSGPKLNGDNSTFYRKTRFDMQFLSNWEGELSKSIIQNEVLFYPNTTIYKIGNFYRYIQYHLSCNQRKYTLEALQRTHYLDLVIDKAFSGLTKNDLASFLISDQIKKDKAIQFIEELISHQILVSEIELTLTGDDFLNKLISLLDNLINNSKEFYLQKETKVKFQPSKTNENDKFRNLKKVTTELLEIDRIENPFFAYNKITQAIKDNKIPYDEKYLFQTDLFHNSNDFQLDNTYAYDIVKTVKFLNKIFEKPKKTLLEDFKNAFIKRYEREAIPLVKALDFETGIGYGQQNRNFDITPLLDTLNIKQGKNECESMDLNGIEKILYNKLQQARLGNEKKIELIYNDFESIDFSHENLPCTFSCVFEIAQENEKEWIVIQSIGGSSAANLAARFCYGNEGINNFAEEIITYESDHYKDKIIAEIIHLPETRTGNILRRPSFRPHEIPYLGKSSLKTSKQISINDILLKMNFDRLILWSKKYDKEIIPRLTNAHNYSDNALPIYHFLCDMQFENCKPSINFDWGNLEKLFHFLPRVTIGNCIVSKARWIFTKEKHPDFFKKLNRNHSVYDKEIFNFDSDNRTFYNEFLPQYISLIEGDNTLIINMENSTCIEILVKAVKNKSAFVLEEYLFPSKTLVTNKNDYFANQFIIGLKSD